ncbi:MAG: glycosyltransferase 87 family protein, partial [Planctomycetota bacterium]
AAGLAAFVVLAGLAFVRALRLVRTGPVPPATLWRLTLPIVGAAVLVPLFASTDAVDYVMRGRIQALHGANPYVHVATGFAGDPFLGFGDAGWKGFPLPYGPIVANLQAGIAWLAHLLPVEPRAELIAALLLCKLLFASALLAVAVVLRRLSVRLHGGDGNVAFVAVAWNPLLLFEGVANAHNEPLVLLCVAVAVAVGERASRGAFALGLGVLVKVVPVVLVPAWVAAAARQRQLRALLVGTAAVAAVAAVFWWQFFREPGAFGVLARQGELRGGSLLWALHQLTGVGMPALVVAGRSVVAVGALLAAVHVGRRGSERELVAATAATMALLAVLGSALFGPWYHVWWVPFALLLGQGFLFRAALLASVTSPLAYLVWAGMRRLDEPSQWCTVVAAVVVPFAGALVWRPRAVT